MDGPKGTERCAEIKTSFARDPRSLGPNGISSDLCLCGRSGVIVLAAIGVLHLYSLRKQPKKSISLQPMISATIDLSKFQVQSGASEWLHQANQKAGWASESSGGCSGNCASVRKFGGTTRTVMKSGFRLAQESASRFVSKNRSITTAFRS